MKHYTVMHVSQTRFSTGRYQKSRVGGIQSSYCTAEGSRSSAAPEQGDASDATAAEPGPAPLKFRGGLGLHGSASLVLAVPALAVPAERRR